MNKAIAGLEGVVRHFEAKGYSELGRRKYEVWLQKGNVKIRLANTPHHGYIYEKHDGGIKTGFSSKTFSAFEEYMKKQ